MNAVYWVSRGGTLRGLASRGAGIIDERPRSSLTVFELQRYLDYCSEMLSLTGKLAVLYVEHYNDPAVLSSVNEVEMLTTGLSRKIWQKLMILETKTIGMIEADADSQE